MKHKRGYYDVFVKACGKYPSRVAVKHFINGKFKTYTYSELYGVCEYISQNLQQLKCVKGIIGLLSDRNAIIPSVMAAAHKCCKTFMFLDPVQDVDNICSEIKFNIIISIHHDGSTVKPAYNKIPERTINIFTYVVNFYCLDTTSAQRNNRHLNEHSFIALTSGSTGVPSQIQVPVRCLQPNIDDLTSLFNISLHDTIYFCTPLTFDPSMVEILLACTNGASLLIAPEKIDIIFSEDKNNSITFWQTTPSKFFQHSDSDIKKYVLCENSTLKTLALGGEPLNGVKRLINLKNKENKTRIFTLYGVTEMSCWACVAELNLNKILTDREVPLGNCLSETQLVVEPTTDDKRSGKIILASDTRKCVILNKMKSERNSSKVDTGDLAVIRDGIVYYAGRTDDIIKRFGHKVNLQHIESVVMQCPEIKSCSCVWLPKPLLLVVYYTSESLNSQELADFLKCKLDDKHWPDNIVRVENIPMNSHGKISRLLLSKLYGNDSEELSLNSLKMAILEEICLLLNKKFTYDDIKNKSFYAIGGTSFQAVSMCNKLSFTYPEFAKLILPHILSQNATIENIMKLAYKEIYGQHKNVKKTVKRPLTNVTGSTICSKSLKTNIPKNKVEFCIHWMYNTRKCVDASPSLFQTERNVFVTVGSHSGKIVVINATSGTLHGKLSLKSRIEASVLCCYEAPDVPCGVVGTYDGTILCYKLQNCIEIWRTNINSMVKSKLCYCNGLLYVAAYDGKVRYIDIKTGAIKHTIALSDQAISADLVIAKNKYLLVGTLSGTCASLDVDTNTVAWRDTLSSPVFASPVLYDAEKYVVFAEVNGDIHCRTVEKGLRIWRYQGAKGNIFSSLLIKETGKLKWQMIFGCHDNNVYSININKFQPSLNWKSSVSAPVYATPCEFNEKLVIAASSDGKIHIMNIENGSILGEYQLPDKTFSSPVVYGDYLFIGCRDDNLYSLKIVMNL